MSILVYDFVCRLLELECLAVQEEDIGTSGKNFGKVGQVLVPPADFPY